MIILAQHCGFAAWAAARVRMEPLVGRLQKVNLPPFSSSQIVQSPLYSSHALYAVLIGHFPMLNRAISTSESLKMLPLVFM